MAIVLTVHVVETIWTRRRDGGLIAPYLVIDHNGQQQQTEAAQAGITTTAWNQKASFAYAPTSGLVVMAFDAGRHGGVFLGQAVVDVAAMLQDGRLHATAPLTSSAGAAVGHVAFEVDLSTSSKALAASLDIPGLTLSSTTSKPSSKSHPADARSSSMLLLDDHLSLSSLPLGIQNSLQTGYIRHQSQQPGQLTPRASSPNNQAGDAADGSPTKLGQKLGNLGHMLGISMHRRRTSEGNTSSPVNPATPASTVPAARSSVDSTLDFMPGPGPLLARRSMLRSSQSSSSGPTAPFMTASMTAAHAAVLQESFAASAAGAAAGAVPAAASETAAAAMDAARAAGSPASGHGGPGSPVAIEQQQRPRYSQASDAHSLTPRSRSSRLSEATTEGGRTDRQADEGGPVAAASRDVSMSPRLSQAHRNSPSHMPRLSMSIAAAAAVVEAPLSPLRTNRMRLRLAPRQAPPSPEQKRLQQQQQIRRDLERLQQLAVQENTVYARLRDGLAGGAGPGRAESDVSGCSSSDDDQLLQDFESADAAGKEAILYRQLMLQQSERKAGSAQLLKLLAAQHHQEAMHDTQLLATLAAMSPSSSPRHQLTNRAVTQSPGGWHYPAIPEPVSPDGRPLNRQQCAPAGPGSRQVNGFAGAGSSGSHSGHGSSSRSHHYPTLPTAVDKTDQHHQLEGQQKGVGNRRQWALPKQAAAAAGIRSGEEPSINSDLWQSCESGSEAATPTSHVANPAGSSKASTHSKAAKIAGDATDVKGKRHPGKLSRLHHTGGGTSSSSPKDIRSYPVDDATIDSAREHDSDGGALDTLATTQQVTAGSRAGYINIDSSSADGGKVDRWYDRYLYDTAAYPVPESVFPARAVVVVPSAPSE